MFCRIGRLTVFVDRVVELNKLGVPVASPAKEVNWSTPYQQYLSEQNASSPSEAGAVKRILLIWATCEGNVAIVRRLLEEGYSPNEIDSEFCSW